MKEKNKKRLAILGVLAVLVVIAMAFAGLFSVVGLQGNYITFTNAPTKSAFNPTENPSFTITTSEFSGTSNSGYCTQYGAYVYITDIYVDGKDLAINTFATAPGIFPGMPGTTTITTPNCNIYGNPESGLCPGSCNSVLAPRPYGEKVTTPSQVALSYSLPADKFALLSPLTPGQHTIKVIGYIAGSCTPPNTKGWTCESAAFSGTAAEWDDTFNVTGTVVTQPGTQPPNLAQPPPTQTVQIPAVITENGTTTIQTPAGNVAGNSMLFAGAIVAVVALLLILAFSEGWIFKKKGR